MKRTTDRRRESDEERTMKKTAMTTPMTHALDFAEIEKAMAQGRRERSLAFTSMIKSLFGGWHNRRSEPKQALASNCAMPA
jgi:hypothetical protein